MDTLLLALLSAALGVMAGLTSGLFGVGGGVVVVPGLLLLGATASFFDAKAASLLAMAIGAIPAVLRHRAAGHVDLRIGLALGLGAVGAAVVSVALVERVAEGTLQAAFGAFLVVVGIRLFLPVEPRGHLRHHRAAPALAVAAGAAAGLLGGAFGVGGGIVMVPALVFAGLTMHAAVATSLVAVVLVGAAATGAHAVLGYGPVLLALGLPVAVGSLLGSRLGAELAQRLHADRLRSAFGAFLVAVGAAMAADALGLLPPRT